MISIEEERKVRERVLRDTQANLAIVRYEAFIRLLQSDDFKTVILDGYIEDKSKELFGMQMMPTMVSPYSKDELYNRIEAIKSFKQYIGIDSMSEIEAVKNIAEAYLAEH